MLSYAFFILFIFSSVHFCRFWQIKEYIFSVIVWDCHRWNFSCKCVYYNQAYVGNSVCYARGKNPTVWLEWRAKAPEHQGRSPRWRGEGSSLPDSPRFDFPNHVWNWGSFGPQSEFCSSRHEPTDVFYEWKYLKNVALQIFITIRKICKCLNFR